ncbi:hypothetical protein [Paraburkholderia adhaesiva]|uniref:hypothetical protein n=1 Tax=Paraburkholderia adhaesiva TaxID=2883244 RepID=UPI001F3C8DC3|nr:hypothetical protein [Paraburkholderia adhaesiva]
MLIEAIKAAMVAATRVIAETKAQGPKAAIKRKPAKAHFGRRLKWFVGTTLALRWTDVPDRPAVVVSES